MGTGLTSAGVFRKAAEITMSILRSNSDSLMSVLEAFAHDPLVEWSSRSVCSHSMSFQIYLISQGKIRTDKDIRSSADRNLAPIRAKLRGQSEINGMVNSVPRQVDMLIKEATSASNLVSCLFACCRSGLMTGRDVSRLGAISVTTPI